MTARLAPHPDVTARTAGVLERLERAGVDVDLVSAPGASVAGERSAAIDPLKALRDSAIDLALVGIRALLGSAAEDLTTVAVLPRIETRDVLVGVASRAAPLCSMPDGARVGVTGARRRALLAAHRPDLEAVELNADAPLTGELPSLDAMVVSALDARDAGLVAATVEALDPKSWIPEPGQGALALVARHPIAEATALDHLPTRTALRTELALLDALDAGGDAPLGCLAQPSGRWIRLWAAAASLDGRRLVRSDRTGPLDEPEALGSAVAWELDARGFGLVAADAP